MTDTAAALPVLDYPMIDVPHPITGEIRTLRGELPEGQAWIYTRRIRTGAVATLAAALYKITRRLPAGIDAHLYAMPASDALWCSSHRVVDCPEMDRQFSNCARGGMVSATEITVTASGVPTFDGTWRVAGTLSMDSNDVVTARTFPRWDAATDDWDPREGFAAGHAALAGQCEHCGRRQRRAVTVLLENAAGDIRPVGRTCLGAYTGGAIRAEVVATLLALGERIRESYGVVEAGPVDSAPVEDIVAVAQLVIARNGFIRSGFGYQGADDTRTTLRKILAPMSNETGTLGIIPAELTAQQRAAARADIEFIRAADAGTDYIANLQATIAVEWAQIIGKGNKLGLLASLPATAMKIREGDERRKAEQAARAAELDGLPNEWIEGPPNGKVTITGKLVGAQWVDNGFGLSLRMSVETDKGLVKWFTSARALVELEPGVTITVTAAIKSRGEYKGRRETVLVRPKLVGEAVPA